MQIFSNCFHCDFYYHCFGLTMESGNQWAKVSEWSWTRAWISWSLFRLEHVTVSSVCSPVENFYLQKQKIWNLHNFVAAVPAVCSKYWVYFFRNPNSHVVWLHEAFSLQWNSTGSSGHRENLHTDNPVWEAESLEWTASLWDVVWGSQCHSPRFFSRASLSCHTYLGFQAMHST